PSALLGLLRHSPGDVSSKHVNAPPGIRRKMVEQDHKDRVRLFSGGTSGAPDVQRAWSRACVCLPFPFRNHHLLQATKLLRIAKEARLIGGKQGPSWPTAHSGPA